MWCLTDGYETCEARDVKGLYKRARSGEIKNYTGIDSPYEVPKKPELEVDTDQFSIEESVQLVLELLVKKGVITIGEVDEKCY